MSVSATWTAPLIEMGACGDAVTWGARFTDAQSAWDACERGDWMLWWLGRSGAAGPPMSDSRRPLVGAAAECTRLSLDLFEKQFPGDGRPRAAIDLCDRFARGEAIMEEGMRAAADAADAAAAADVAYTAYAAYTAYVAYTADTADTAYGAARVGRLKECAIIVRRWFPHPPNTEGTSPSVGPR